MTINNRIILPIIPEEKNGPTILYLHGWSHVKEVWNDVIESRLDSYRHVAIDTPGFGGSTLPADFSFCGAGYARCLHLFLEKTGCKPDMIVAHSMGGLIALSYMSIYRNDFNKLMICGSPLSGVPLLQPLFFFPPLMHFLFSCLRKTPNSLLRILCWPTTTWRNLNKIENWLLEMIKTHPVHTMIEALRFATFFTLPSIDIASKQLLLLRGAKEIILSHSDARRYARFLSAQLIEMTNVSHSHMLEDFSGFMRIYDDFAATI